MRAIVQDRYGPAEVLRPAEVDEPEPGAGEIVVRVRAAGVDPSVWHIMTGRPYLMRLMGFGLRAPKVRVRGWDAAGTVAAVGAGVTRFAPGDDVFGIGSGGTFAEYCRGPAEMFAAKPAGVDFDAAAAVPTSAITALRALRDAGGLRTGGHVLVLGAGGGVGEEVRGLLESGTVEPVVGRRYALDEAAEAIRDWEKGHTRGKSVLIV